MEAGPGTHDRGAMQEVGSQARQQFAPSLTSASTASRLPTFCIAPLTTVEAVDRRSLFLVPRVAEASSLSALEPRLWSKQPSLDLRYEIHAQALRVLDL